MMESMPPSDGHLHLGEEVVDGIRVHQRARHMPMLPAGPFVRVDERRVLSVAGNPAQLYVSDDNGETWRSRTLLPEGAQAAPAHTGALVRTRAGAIVLGFPDVGHAHWTWDDKLRDAPGARLPTCAVRSTDGGETWRDLQTLHDDWTGATRSAIQLTDGRVVFTSMQMRNNPGRHTVMCYYSDDEGATWRPSNVMDLGGNGHHDGLTEGCIVELKDGRLLQYIRTNWGQLWLALSLDRGETWHPYGPTGVPASSTPPLLKRLASGRVLLLWNRPTAEGENSFPSQGGDGIWSAAPASNFRAELSMSFSDDECQTWAPPTVIARSDIEERSPEVCYPYAFEPEPGVLWITAHRWNLRMSLREADFVG